MVALWLILAGALFLWKKVVNEDIIYLGIIAILGDDIWIL